MPYSIWDNLEPTDEETPCGCDECMHERGECDPHRCSLCAKGEYEPESTNDDIDPVEQKPPALLIPAIPTRRARYVSIEQEIDGDAVLVARRLYDSGVSEHTRTFGYHSDPGTFCYLENDATVDGEIIYSMMRMDNVTIAKKLERAIDTVQECLSDGTAKLTTRAGFHVHVGIGYDGTNPCYSMSAVESLYHLWNYLEDVVYRLASANWRGHRSEISDNEGTTPTPKGYNGPIGVGRAMQRDRYYSLNLSNFLAARGSCRCGAFEFGEWSSCTCTLEKPTAEFRVFNATANKRKMRAYVALCLALVSYAEDHEVSENGFEAMPWNGSSAIVDTEQSEALERRLRFILRELPLTENEREDIRYCAKRSSLKGIVGNIRRRKGYRAALAAIAV